MRVLIVCTGNTCRSPMLMYMLRRYLAQTDVRDIEVDSAGLMRHFKPISEFTDDVLTRHKITHGMTFSKFCDRELLDKADLVFTMTKEQAEQLATAYGKNKKVVPLAVVMGEDVADPYGQGQQAYDGVYADFESSLKKIVAYIKRRQKRLEASASEKAK